MNSKCQLFKSADGMKEGFFAAFQPLAVTEYTARYACYRGTNPAH